MTSGRRHRSERGAAITEFALLAPVMVLLVMGVVDLARGYQMQIRLENAAREGAALAQFISPDDTACATDVDAVVARALSEDVGMAADVHVYAEDAGGDFTVDLNASCAGDVAESGDRVRVEASASFDVIVPMVERIVGDEIELTGSAEIEVQG